MWPRSGRRSSLLWWLCLTLAAVVLTTWMTVGLAGAIARADTAPASAGETSSQGSPGPKHESPKHESPTRESPTHESPTHASPTHEASPGPTTPDPGNPPTPIDHPGTLDRTTTNGVTSGSAAKPPAQPPARHSQPPRDVPRPSASSALPAKASTAPTSRNSAATSRNSAALTQQPASIPRPLAATVAPTDPAPSSAQSGAIDIPQLGRQFVGLVSDVGVVAASAVYTAAKIFAAAFGPNSFLGVPYALATVVANSAAAVSRTLIGAPLDAGSSGPFPVNYGLIDGLTFFNPQQPPPGANDPSITVTAAHPLPIILINGTFATQGTNWGVGAAVLADAGYKVYTFNYGNIFGDPNFPIQATDDIRQSGLQLAAEVDKVLAETGAPKVILIGHSQGGGILPEYYINNLGGADKVSQLIGIAPSNHGTNADGLTGLLNLPILGPLLVDLANMFGQALLQQTVGSPFQQVVYGNGDTRPGVLYTTIASTNDEIVTPYTQQALTGPNVTNIVLQDLYPGLPAGHLGEVLSPQVWSVVLNALASNPQANPLHDQELVA